jgi:hypothetical protein
MENEEMVIKMMEYEFLLAKRSSPLCHALRMRVIRNACNASQCNVEAEKVCSKEWLGLPCG